MLDLLNVYVDTRPLVLCLFAVEFGSCSIISSNNAADASESTISLVVLAAVCLAFLVVLVLTVMSCGGCNDMSGDVATENHPACGKQGNHFSPVVADANTSVLMSGHSMGESSSMIPPQNLPYSLQPAASQGFTGYQSVATAPPSAPGAQAAIAGAHRPVFEPPPPSYDQLNRQGGLAGYGSY